MVSRSVYDNLPSNVQVGEILPPNCASTKAGCPTNAAAFDGTYPFVWNNALDDPSFTDRSAAQALIAGAG